MGRATVRDLVRCQTCGSDEMAAVTDGEMTNFRCVACGDCWHTELGWVHRVDPVTCPGCWQVAECRGRLRS